MDILNLSTDWAKAEVFSAKISLLLSLLFFLAGFGFWRLGETSMAKAFIWPVLAAGIFILAVAAALLILFVNTTMWRAIGITTIALTTILMFIDSNTNARNTAYHQHLSAEKQ